jgi:uncharacterized C2H2 Zn-finger protein
LIEFEYEEGEEMLQCPRCGAEIQSSSVYCWRCGAKLHISEKSRAPEQDEPPERKSASLLLQKWQSSSLWHKMAAFILMVLIIRSAGVYFTGENTLSIEPPETPQPQKDTDNDGIPDNVDDCLNPGCTIVNSRGCPKDTDGDGLQDCYDNCPNERGEKSNKGCPVEEKIVSIKICLVNYNAPGDDNENPNGEWVQICNDGNQDVDMSGWRLYDNAQLWRTVTDHVFIFPSGFVLRAGQSVFVYTGIGTNTSTKLYFGRPPGEYAAIWNNDGDCAYLEDDKGNLVDSRCWS